jgi:hypothetical protein
MLSVVILNVIRLSVIMLSVAILSVIILSVIMLSIVAPNFVHKWDKTKTKLKLCWFKEFLLRLLEII